MEYTINFMGSQITTRFTCQYCWKTPEKSPKVLLAIYNGLFSFNVTCPECNCVSNIQNGNAFKNKSFYCTCGNFMNITVGVVDYGYQIKCGKCDTKYEVEKLI